MLYDLMKGRDYLFGKSAAIQHKFDRLEREVFDARQRGISVVRVRDVIDVLAHGKLTSADLDDLFSFVDKLQNTDKTHRFMCRSMANKSIPNINAVNRLLVQNMFREEVYCDPVYVSPVKPIQYNFAAMSVMYARAGDYVACLLDFCISLIGVKDGILPMFLERKLTGDEIMFFSTVAFSVGMLCMGEDK